MNQIEGALRRIDDSLKSLNVPFALVGGLAVSVRAEPRFTRDADIAVDVATDDAAELAIRALVSNNWRIETLVEQDAVGRLATARLAWQGETEGPVVDLLFASSGIEAEIVADAEPLEVWPELECRVARVGHLIALKTLSRDDVRRPQDAMDLRLLLSVATAEELTRAERAASLIVTRGYHRGRDLSRDLRVLIDECRARDARR